MRHAEPSFEQAPPSWFGALVGKIAAVWPQRSSAAHITPARHGVSARSQRHSAWTIALHWASVIAIVVAAVAALSRELTEDSAVRDALMVAHRQAGLFVLFALGLRLAVRFGVGMKDHAGSMPKLMKLAAVMAHLTLYAMLLALPLLGWAVTNAHGVEVKLFGVVPLPMLVQEDSDLSDKFTDWHVLASWGLLFLVVAHVSAACWHHFARRDGVLAAMLPWVKVRNPRVLVSSPVATPAARPQRDREQERRRA